MSVGLPYSLLALGHLGGLRLLGFLTGHDDCLAQTLQTVKMKRLTWMFSSFPLSAKAEKKKEGKNSTKTSKAVSRARSVIARLTFYVGLT